MNQYLRIYGKMLVIMIIGVFVLSTLVVRSASVSRKTASAQTVCNTVDKSVKVTDAFRIPISTNDYQNSSTAEYRHGRNTLTKTIPNVYISSTKDFYFSARQFVRPSTSNLINTGFIVDNGYVITLQRIRDGNNNVVSNEYYTSFLVNFNNLYTNGGTSPIAPNIPSTFRQYALHSGWDVSSTVRSSTNYPDIHPPYNRIYFDNRVASPVYNDFGTVVNLEGRLISEFEVVGNAAANQLSIGSIVTAKSIGINSMYGDSNFGNQLIRKDFQSGTTAKFFDPYNYLKKAGIDHYQPQKFHKLPNYYKNISAASNTNVILDHANPARSQYSAGGGPIIDRSQIPTGVYTLKVDIIDTFGTESRSGRFYVNYTEYDINCNTKPEFRSFNLRCVEQNNQYKIHVAIEISSRNEANIIAMLPVLSPANVTDQYFFNGADATPENGKVIKGYFEDSSPVNRSTANYSITNPNFIAEPDALLEFDVTFNTSTAASQTFYNNFVQNGFNLYLYAADEAFQDTLETGGKMPKVASLKFIPLDECINVYYSTGSGDFRTNELGSYQDNLVPDVMYGEQGNKYWQTQNSTNPPASFEDKNNYIENVSSTNFLFEGIESLGDNSNYSTNSFESDIPLSGASVQRETIMSSLVSSINQSITIKRLSSDSITEFNSSQTTYPWITGKNTSTKTLDINLGTVPVNNYVIIINDYKTITITDSISAPDNILIWCQTTACNVRVKPFTTAIGTVALSTVNGKRVVTYDNTGVKNTARTKSRIYLNYKSGEQPATPIAVEGTIINETTVPAARKFELMESSTTASNYYLGAFLTSGFVYSGKSSKTDVIKGFIQARGIVANATNANISGLYFKDYVNPFLFVDYDPKYYIQYYSLLPGSTSSAKIKYVGI